MTVNQLLTLMSREQQTLTEENNHSAAVIMAEAAAMIRVLAERASDDAPHERVGAGQRPG